ncbi:MAG: hypothetical protein RL184_66 [Pseudomonadota bacterium]
MGGAMAYLTRTLGYLAVLNYLGVRHNTNVGSFDDLMASYH